MPHTITDTWTYRANGYSDEVHDCEHCGRTDLKGTVHMLMIDSDGGVDGELYMGTGCAATMTGRKISEIRSEALAADRARRDAELEARQEWNARRGAWVNAMTKAHFGNKWVRPRVHGEWTATPEFQAAEAEWLAANPAPTTT